jgi:hypothetical protein
LVFRVRKRGAGAQNKNALLELLWPGNAMKREGNAYRLRQRDGPRSRNSWQDHPFPTRC